VSQKITGVAFTGGGSGGHTIAALSLADDFKSRGLQNIIYIGSHDGIEKELCANTSYPYYSVSTGKLRRYFSWDNFKDVLKLVRGIFQALGLLGSRRDINCIIATGGYVAVPVVIAGWLLRKKIYLHEQTTRIGLANRICAKFCDKIFVSFEDSKKYLPAKKAIYSGYPLRKEIYHDFLKVENFDGINLLSPSRPILFVTGGGNGAKLINDLVLKHLDDLKSKFIIIHQVGKQFLGQFGAFKDESYHPVAFIGPEMISILKSATLIISRAGAGDSFRAHGFT
jgi:UDP-N-acetylglucosamine--N-acetylmuramyl-(pentapeptide) pyrophosphoryl-undecaprenol N-acetylglucosamine transferase